MTNPFMLEQAAMYLAYHRDHRNVLTHVVGVPMIMFAILIVLQRVALDSVLPGLTLGSVAVVVLGLFYVWMQPVAGVILTILIAIGAFLAIPLALASPTNFWAAVAIFFVGGWTFQLVGHAVFEHRRPALTDNLLQIFMAPLFLVLETMFRLGTFRDLEAQIEKRSHAYDADRVGT